MRRLGVRAAFSPPSPRPARRLAPSFETVQASDGFSGAEIEQAIVTALYAMIADRDEALTTERLVAELRSTVPLSRSRREDIEAERAFAAERFVPAR
jgi:hypothetical protein